MFLNVKPTRVWCSLAVLVVLSTSANAGVNVSPTNWPDEIPYFHFAVEVENHVVYGTVRWLPVEDIIHKTPLNYDKYTWKINRNKEGLEYKWMKKCIRERENRTEIVIDVDILHEVVLTCVVHVCSIVLDCMMALLQSGVPAADLHFYTQKFEVNQHSVVADFVDGENMCYDRFNRSYTLDPTFKQCIYLSRPTVISGMEKESIMPFDARTLLPRVHALTSSFGAPDYLKSLFKSVDDIDREPMENGNATCMFVVHTMLCRYPPDRMYAPHFFHTEPSEFLCPVGFHHNLTLYDGHPIGYVNQNNLSIATSDLQFAEICEVHIKITARFDWRFNRTLPIVEVNLKHDTKDRCRTLKSLNLNDAKREINSVSASYCPYHLSAPIEFCVPIVSRSFEKSLWLKELEIDEGTFNFCAYQTEPNGNVCYFHLEPTLRKVLRLRKQIKLNSVGGLSVTAKDSPCTAYYHLYERERFKQNCYGPRMPENYDLDIPYATFLDTFTSDRTIYICTCNTEHCEMHQDGEKLTTEIEQKFNFSCYQNHAEIVDGRHIVNNITLVKTFEMLCYFSANVTRVDEAVHITYKFSEFEDYMDESKLRVQSCMTAAEWDEHYRGALTPTTKKPELYSACKKFEAEDLNTFTIHCCCRLNALGTACNALERIERAVELADHLEQPKPLHPRYCQDESANAIKVDECDDLLTNRGNKHDLRCYFIYQLEGIKIVQSSKGCFVRERDVYPMVRHMCGDTVFELTKEYFKNDRFCNSNMVDLLDDDDELVRQLIVCCDAAESRGTTHADWLDVDDYHLVRFEEA